MARLFLLTIPLLFVIITAVDSSSSPQWAWPKPSCDGSIAECLGEEFEMDTEINRRILATTKYISYDALKKNAIPCSQRGASYYNCKTGAEANPYQRGCSAITKCRGG